MADVLVSDLKKVVDLGNGMKERIALRLKVTTRTVDNWLIGKPPSRFLKPKLQRVLREYLDQQIPVLKSTKGVSKQ